MMAGLLGRANHLAGLVRSTLHRDLEVRGIRQADRELVGSTYHGHAQFTACRPLDARSIPAIGVPMQSVAEYQAALDLAARTMLDFRAIGNVRYTGAGALRTVLGIRDHEWSEALRVLLAEIPGALVGVDSEWSDPSAARYVDARGPLGPAEEASAVHLLVPAVVRHRGNIIKRFGFESALRLEKWSVVADSWTASIWNPVTSSLGDEEFRSRAEKLEDAGRSSSVTSTPHLMQVTFPIDAVYTWVDGTDPAWLERKRAALEHNLGHPMPEAAADDLRFVGHDELRHSLRSLEQYAPWIRHVYLVTDGQRPDWLREDSEWVTVVDHRDIAPPGTVLPTFNSQAIEANLHRIDGLSEHFLYFNDDMFLSSPVQPELFFHANGLASMFLSRAQVAPGEPVEGEPAPDAAGKNARRLVQEVSGRRLSRKLFHAPYALRRSVSYEIEERWPEIVQRTRDSQFRRLEDVTLAGGLHLNYAYATSRAVTRGIRYRYVGIGEETAAAELRRLIADRDSLKTFCLNDAVQELPSDVVDRQVRAFLAERFPDMGSFEKLPD